MTTGKMTLSPLYFFLIGMFISALLGGIESQLLLDKTLLYRESILWKCTLLFYSLTMAYVFWFYETKPILRNIYVFVLSNVLLSLPFFIVLVLTKTYSIISILTIIPSQIFFLAFIFASHVIGENNPKLRMTSLWITSFIIAIGVTSIAVLLNMPRILYLLLGSMSPFIYFLLVLYFITRNNKKKLELSEHDEQ